MANYEYKYNKYKSKYLKLKAYMDTITQQNGGGDKNDKKDKKLDNKDEYTVQVDCIEIYRDDQDRKSKEILCKTPPIKIRFHTPQIKIAFLIKSLMRLINKNHNIRFVKSVEIIENKDKKIYDGDKLGEDIDLTQKNSFKSVTIKL